MDLEAKRLKGLRDILLQRLKTAVPEMGVNGDMESRIGGNLNISFPGFSGEELVAGFKRIAVSGGSACTSASVEPSYVLKAIGLEDEAARASFRIGMGRFTTEAEVIEAADVIIAEIERQRSKNKVDLKVSNG